MPTPGCTMVAPMVSHLGPWLRQWHAVKSSIQVNYLGGSARSCHMAPFTSHHPIRRPGVEASLYVCAPSPLCAGPQMKVQHSVKENCHPCDMPVGLSMLLSSGPAHFEPPTVLGPCVELPSVCTCGPRLQLLVIKWSVFLVSWTRLSTQLSPPLILAIINPPTSGLKYA
jgi:hypothetical protein